MVTRDREKSAAYHEAGHAIVALRLGFDLRSVDIHDAEDSAGLTRIDPPMGFDPFEATGNTPALFLGEAESFQWWVDITTWSWAGTIAQQRGGHGEWGFGLVPVDDAGTALISEGSDFEHIANASGVICRSDAEAEAFREWTRRRAEAFLDEEWDHVVVVAEALIERREMNRAEVLELIWPPRDSVVKWRSIEGT